MMWFYVWPIFWFTFEHKLSPAFNYKISIFVASGSEWVGATGSNRRCLPPLFFCSVVLALSSLFFFQSTVTCLTQTNKTHGHLLTSYRDDHDKVCSLTLVVTMALHHPCIENYKLKDKICSGTLKTMHPPLQLGWSLCNHYSIGIPEVSYHWWMLFFYYGNAYFCGDTVA